MHGEEVTGETGSVEKVVRSLGTPKKKEKKPQQNKIRNFATL